MALESVRQNARDGADVKMASASVTQASQGKIARSELASMTVTNKADVMMGSVYVILATQDRTVH